MAFLPADEQFLLRAVELAEGFVGATAPNPAVGAVCVADGVILGEGAHQGAGLPHAEVNCLAACGRSPEGATLYVTLEPCSTFGRTPPCCDLIRAKGIGRVVIGCLDPNPKHAGRALTLLREAGIAVDVAEGAVAARCRELLEPFAKAITVGLPFVRLKLALTLDGYLADGQGCSQWVTGEAARRWVHALRARVDAVLVGAGTVRADHPDLRPRLVAPPKEALPKWRVLVDRSQPIEARDCDARTLVATRDLGYDGRDLEALLRGLCARGINDVLCEGGGTLAGALLEADLVDELVLMYAPKILGDPAGVRALPIAPRALTAAQQWEIRVSQVLGDDLCVQLRRRGGDHF